MHDDAVLQRLANARPGMRLVAHREAAIPIFRLTLDVVIEENKPVPPIEEYVLKALAAGLTSIDSVAGFLGIERRLVEVAVHDLWGRDDIDLSGGVLSLTPSGKQSLEDLVSRAPVRTEGSVDFDRMLFTVNGPATYSHLKPRDLRDAGLEELPLPRGHAKRPAIEDLDFESLAAAIKRGFQGGGSATEVLAVRGVVRADRFFDAAHVLVYVAENGSDYTLAVAVDGRLSPAHEEALGAAGGAERLGIDLQQLASSTDLEQLASPEVVAQVVPDEQLRAAEQEVARLERALAEPADDLDEPDTVGTKQEVEQALTEARHRLADFQIRRLRVYEHAPLLRKSLTTVQRRLLIISPWISRAVVDDEFLTLLAAACRRRVRIHIGYGIGPAGGDRPRDPVPERSLRRLASSHSNFTFKDLGNTHAKVLVADDIWVTTSFNWLSFKGDRDRTFRQEEGLLVRVPGDVDDAYQDFRRQIDDAAG